MPHFVIEYSAGSGATMPVDAILDAVCAAGVRSGIMNPRDIKVRAIAYDAFRFEDGIRSFLHVTVSLLEGRTDDQKEKLALLLRDALDTLCPGIDSISIDIRDMNPVAYKKRLKTRLN